MKHALLISSLVGGLMALAGARGAQAQTAPEITIAGQPFPTIDDALASAVADDTINLGEGTLTLASSVLLPAGVRLQGVSARSTHLDASGLDVGIRVSGNGGGSVAASVPVIGGLELFGATRGIEVMGAQGVVIRNVVLRDNQESGLSVAEDAEVSLINATLVRNGTGVVASGTTRVRNTVITGGGNGLAAPRVGALVSSFNDLFVGDLSPDAANTAATGAAYDHVLRGMGDLDYVVSFVDFAQNDFRLTDNQAVTDRGDPTDDFANEPAPNGARVNLGAFGNTADAELSAPPVDKPAGGCAIGGTEERRQPLSWAAPIAAAMALLARKRKRE